VPDIATRNLRVSKRLAFEEIYPGRDFNERLRLRNGNVRYSTFDESKAD
jgi:hypothetical protein